MVDDRVEQAFDLIQQGNESLETGELWQASDSFCQAQDLLQKLSRVNRNTHSVASTGETEDATKIANLYQQQSIEYRKQARQCLIKALEVEHEKKSSEDDQSQEAILAELSDEEALARVELFCCLFSKPLTCKTTANTSADATEQQSSLEERLKQLNASLPQGFKTSDERMSDINRGLNRLGLSLYSNLDQPKSSMITSLPEPNKSESDQVDDIIAQAKDEVALGIEPLSTTEQGTGIQSSNYYLDAVLSDEDEDGAVVDSDLDDDAADDASLTPETVQAVADKVVDAQATLAELVALLNESSKEDSSDPVLLDRATARHSLKKARVLLLEATKQLVVEDS